MKKYNMKILVSSIIVSALLFGVYTLMKKPDSENMSDSQGAIVEIYNERKSQVENTKAVIDISNQRNEEYKKLEAEIYN